MVDAAGIDKPSANSTGHQSLDLSGWNAQRGRSLGLIVGDQRAGPADASGEFIMGDTELVEQLLIGRGLFQGVQLHPVDVLEQSIAQQVVFTGLAHDRGDRRAVRVVAGDPRTGDARWRAAQ